MGATPLLDVRDLSIGFGQHAAVKGISFQINAGETLGLVGESGSGKSAASLAVLRLLPYTATVRGVVEFDGEDLLGLPEEAMRRRRGREIAMIFQEPMTALNPVMPVGAQIAEAVRAHHPGAPAVGPQGRDGARGGAARTRWHPLSPTAIAGLSARAFRRHASAGDDRARGIL